MRLQRTKKGFDSNVKRRVFTLLNEFRVQNNMFVCTEVNDVRIWIIFWFSYLTECPVSFGWTFGPVGRLRVLLLSEISTETRRRRLFLVSSFHGHKGDALRKATATIRAVFFLLFLLLFFFTCFSDSSSLLSLRRSDPDSSVLFLAFISRGKMRFSQMLRVGDTSASYW